MKQKKVQAIFSAEWIDQAGDVGKFTDMLDEENQFFRSMFESFLSGITYGSTIEINISLEVKEERSYDPKPEPEPQKKKGYAINFRSPIQLPESTDTLEVSDIKKILGCGQCQAYNLVNSGVFHVVRVGRKLKVPKASFYDWYNGSQQKEE